MTRYIVVAAPGHYMDSTTVIDAFGSLDLAIRKANHLGSRVCVREGHDAIIDADGSILVSQSSKGDRWLRVYEEGNPILFQRLGSIRRRA